MKLLFSLGSRSLFALVEESGPKTESRTFHRNIDNATVVVGGGINDLARPGVEVTVWPCEVRIFLAFQLEPVVVI